jgi:hypothetical protein
MVYELRANFVYSNLNPCGGGERFTLVTMEVLFVELNPARKLRVLFILQNYSKRKKLKQRLML